MARTHLAIIQQRYVGQLLAGRKRIESRFMRRRLPPLDRISAGDQVYFKSSGGNVIGRCRALKVSQFDNLTANKIFALRDRHNLRIRATAEYWRKRSRCRYGVLIWLGPVRATARVKVPRQFGSGWVLLGE